MAIQNGTMPGTNHVDIQGMHQLQRICHIGLLEGAEDVVKIIFCCSEVALRIGYGASENPLMGIMRAKGITGNKGFILLDIGIHGIGPMQIRQKEELQGFIADFQLISVFDGDAVEILIHDIFQKADCRRGRDDFRLRVFRNDMGDGTGMIRLGMVYNNIINLRDIQLLGQCRSVLSEEFFLRGFKKNRFIPRLENVGIIGGAEFRIHNDVKYAQVLIQNPCPIKILFQL